MIAETVVLRFTWASPPIHLNQSGGHWAKRSTRVADVRRAGYFAAVNQLRGIDHVTAQLVWWVNTKTKRDTDNVVPTLKALCDGVVDAGVVPDDTPRHMTKPEVQIRYRDKADGAACMELHLTPGFPMHLALAQHLDHKCKAIHGHVCLDDACVLSRLVLKAAGL